LDLQQANSSKHFSGILSAQQPHNLHSIVLDAVVDRMDTADCAPVALADMIDGGKQEGVLGNLFEADEKLREIAISLNLAILLKTVAVDLP
jgi:hypothetical protein